MFCFTATCELPLHLGDIVKSIEAREARERRRERRGAGERITITLDPSRLCCSLALLARYASLAQIGELARRLALLSISQCDKYSFFRS